MVLQSWQMRGNTLGPLHGLIVLHRAPCPCLWRLPEPFAELEAELSACVSLQAGPGTAELWQSHAARRDWLQLWIISTLDHQHRACGGTGSLLPRGERVAQCSAWAGDKCCSDWGCRGGEHRGEESNLQLRGLGNFQINSLALIFTRFPSE